MTSAHSPRDAGRRARRRRGGRGPRPAPRSRSSFSAFSAGPAVCRSSGVMRAEPAHQASETSPFLPSAREAHLLERRLVGGGGDRGQVLLAQAVMSSISPSKPATPTQAGRLQAGGRARSVDPVGRGGGSTTRGAARLDPAIRRLTVERRGASAGGANLRGCCARMRAPVRRRGPDSAGERASAANAGRMPANGVRAASDGRGSGAEAAPTGSGAGQASAALACSTMAPKAAGSCTARSARTLRSTSIPALVEAVDEARVGQAGVVLADGGVDPLDPERAEVALADLAVAGRVLAAPCRPPAWRCGSWSSGRRSSRRPA